MSGHLGHLQDLPDEVGVPAVETRSLSKRFGERLAVDEVDLTVPQATAFGFLGPNGAGKTTPAQLADQRKRETNIGA